MARRRLTNFSIKNLKAKDRYYEVTDTSGVRLGIQPLPSSTKSFLTRYRRPGTAKPAKVTHGTHPALSLAAARVAHAEALRKLAEGVDPGAESLRAKAEARQAEADRLGDTFHKHAQAFLSFQEKRLRKTTLNQQRHVLAIAQTEWGPNRAVTDIRRRDVIELAEEIAETRPVMANRVVSVLHRFFWWLTTRDVIPANPVSGVVRPSKEHARERALSPAEIRALWPALDSVGGPLAAATKVLLLTGQRRSEVVEMRRSELDGDALVLPPTRTKNKKPHTVPLSRQALDVIERQPVLGDFVFSRDGRRPAGDLGAFKKKLDAVAKLGSTWRLHDLRRTCASGMQRLGVAPQVVEKSLNHRSGVYAGIAGVYQVDELAGQVRDALARWGDYVERIVRGEEPGKVIQLRS
jgi:integrase